MDVTMNRTVALTTVPLGTNVGRKKNRRETNPVRDDMSAFKVPIAESYRKPVEIP